MEIISLHFCFFSWFKIWTPEEAASLSPQDVLRTKVFQVLGCNKKSVKLMEK